MSWQSPKNLSAISKKSSRYSIQSPFPSANTGVPCSQGSQKKTPVDRRGHRRWPRKTDGKAVCCVAQNWFGDLTVLNRGLASNLTTKAPWATEKASASD